MPRSQSMEGRALSRTTGTLVVVAAVLALILTATTALGAVYRYPNGGAVTSVRAAVTTQDPWGTDAQTFTAISGMGVNVNVPSGQRAVLIITMSVEEGCSYSGYCSVVPYLDGSPLPPVVQFDIAAGSVYWEARSFQWVSGVLGPGAHSITMAGKATVGAFLYLRSRTLTVLSSKR